MATTVQKDTSWKRIPAKQYGQKDIIRIITFFVFHSPCAGTSAQGKSLAEYGWHTPWKKPYYLNKQLKQTATNQNLLFSASKYEILERTLSEHDCDEHFPPDNKMEAAFFYLDGKKDKSQFLCLFRHIRNAVAHGRVRIINAGKNTAFVFEDVNPKNKISARIILRKSTLLKWIDMIEAGEKEYTKT